MSVLSFPRIYFQGYMEWDPCTFNNNDWQEFPTYDGVNAALNWPFLATQGITPQNFPSTFRPWAIGLQPDCVDQPPGERLPAEWNMFGSHAVKFVQFQKGEIFTKITSGALSPTEPVTSDPLIGGPVVLSGNRTTAKLVDTNPASFWSSQVYWEEIAFGSGDCVISGPRQVRMHSRWLNLGRVYNANSALTQPAASVACCFQTAIPFDDVSWPTVTSPLAEQLKTAASAAVGIMVRFTAYVNVYFANGKLNDFFPRPRTYKDLAAALQRAWDEFNNNNGSTKDFFSNPCYSHIVGTLGVWSLNEVASAPVGRYLPANLAVSPQQACPTPPPPPAPAPGTSHGAAAAAAAPAPSLPSATLGPMIVEVNDSVISLDLGSTMPECGPVGEWPSDLVKANFGTLDFGVMNPTFTSIAEISYDQYAQAAYEGTAGIIDIPFSQTKFGSGTGTVLASGPLAVQIQPPSGDPVTALEELQYSAQTDSRGIYLDQNGTAEFPVAVYNFGAISPNTSVLVAQYDQSLSVVPAGATPLVTFTNGQQSTVSTSSKTCPSGPPTNVTVVQSDETGVATVGIAAASPGFAVLAFYPFSGDPQTPACALLGPLAPTSGSITYAYYATVRVLPFDDALPQQFVDLWNSTHDATLAWQFIYNNILYLYDMVFSVMLEFVNLGDQQQVIAKRKTIWTLTSEEYAAENSGAMPVTRDLSAGKRKTLHLWIYLVANQQNVENFSVDSIPEGWEP